MKTIEKTVPLPLAVIPDRFRAYLSAHKLTLDDVLIFDIETTGLKKETSVLYLIGIARLTKDALHITQFLAQTPEEEPQVLHAFAKALSSCRLLVHFNGDRFDLPFVAMRNRIHGIASTLTIGVDPACNDITSYDLYKEVRPFKTVLGLPDCRLKSIERLLNCDRSDTMSGGELIGVYHEYAKSADPAQEALLLLHNADDLTGTCALLQILDYPDFFISLSPSSFSSVTARPDTYTDFQGREQKELFLSCDVKKALPAPFACHADGIHLRYDKGQFLIRVPVFRDELKHFFPDHENYYYLPHEDMAVHKSVGEFVDKAFRRKAKKEEACVKREGDFIIAFHETALPVFRHTLKEKAFYIESSEDILSSEPELLSYVTGILRHLAGFS